LPSQHGGKGMVVMIPAGQGVFRKSQDRWVKRVASVCKQV